MLKYNLCLIRQGNKILLLNRERNQWMGCWNGVGGKLEPQEQARDSMLREIYEETGIASLTLKFKGILTWSSLEKRSIGGLFFYLGVLPDNYEYPTPKKTVEGILDWKEIDWVLHPDNLGVATNLPLSLTYALEKEGCFDHHSVFDGNQMVQQSVTEISPQLESDETLRNIYLEKYLNLRKLPS